MLPDIVPTEEAPFAHASRGMMLPREQAHGLLAACFATALGRRAGNTEMQRKGIGKSTSLVQFTNPPKEAVDAAAADRAQEESTMQNNREHHDGGPDDCSLSMHKCHKWSLGDIKKLYKNGQPGNHLSVVGLTVHGFDGTLQGHPNFIGQNNSTEEETAKLAKRPLPWKPCISGWCKNSAKWLSTSVINARHHPGFSDGGIILKPSANTVKLALLISGFARPLPRDHVLAPPLLHRAP